MYQLISLFLLLCVSHAYASEANVVDANVIHEADGSFTFKVTVQHTDEGWQHYADHWLILDKDEQLIAARKLLHPHVKEQPFTRDLSYIEIPETVKEVIIRAHCSVDGYTGYDFALNIETQDKR